MDTTYTETRYTMIYRGTRIQMTYKTAHLHAPTPAPANINQVRGQCPSYNQHDLK